MSLRKLVGALAGLGLVLSCYSALSRYLFPAFARGWVDELVIYAIVWSVWLCGGLLAIDGSHVRTDFLSRILPTFWARRVARAADAIGLAFALLLTYAGLLVVATAMRLGETGDSSLTLPLWCYYAGLPVGMALMAWRYWQRLTRKDAP